MQENIKSHTESFLIIIIQQIDLWEERQQFFSEHNSQVFNRWRSIFVIPQWFANIYSLVFARWQTAINKCVVACDSVFFNHEVRSYLLAYQFEQICALPIYNRKQLENNCKWSFFFLFASNSGYKKLQCVIFFSLNRIFAFTYFIPRDVKTTYFMMILLIKKYLI